MPDWDHIRRAGMSKEAPPDWPSDVRAISTEGLSLLGIDQKTGKLHWDGREVRTRTHVRLGVVEMWLAAVATSAAIASVVLEIGRSASWWP
jgi:hypothetical protein